MGRAGRIVAQSTNEIGYVFRHDPCTKKIKELLGAKIIGNIVEADFYCGSWLPDWREGIDYRKCVSSKRELGRSFT